MKGLARFGEYFWEFLVVTLIAAASAVTVLPFVPVTVGLCAFFRRGIDERRFKDIFTTIGANWKILIFYTLFQLVIIVFPVLNIYFFNTHPERLNGFVLAVSVIALVFGVFYLATAPTLIVNMNLTFRQLLRNGIMLLFGGLLRSICAVACIAGVVALILWFPYAVVLTLYAVPYINCKLMGENFYKLKAKALGTTVEKLKAEEHADDYLDEYGRVKRAVNADVEQKDEEKSN